MFYGEGACFSDGLIPRRPRHHQPHFRREAVGIVEQNGARITVSGIDIVRDEGGRLRVLEGQRPHSFGGVLRHRKSPRDDPELRLGCSPSIAFTRWMSIPVDCYTRFVSRRADGIR